ncbi:cystathionine gamma-synthase [Trichomonascus vanleenenianus]|uniref:cystathionine gamma-synthase n=1 Tax=Trichomonascus vanleenenianus TaxID=2268995 RepID=UPI003EC9AB86
MHSGYPRFYIHQTIQKLCRKLEEQYGRANERAFVFPSNRIAKRCREFVVKFGGENASARIVQVAPSDTCRLSVVLVPGSLFPVAKKYWQHTGEGISSRLAEFSLAKLFPEDLSTSGAADEETAPHAAGAAEFLEERFGRNLGLDHAQDAKNAICKRIASKASTEGNHVDAEDVYLYPTGMTSIFSAHRALRGARGEQLKSIAYGLPYVDSLQIMTKFGAGVHFYGNASKSDLDEIERLLESGEKVLMLFCEFPSNPLIKAPDLARIKKLAFKYDFAVVVDETVGNFSNVDVLPYADIVVSSLTKVFSGDSNVMGGSLVVNKRGSYYRQIKEALTDQYEDTMWSEDAIYLERNSRDFEDRSKRINKNAEAVAELFHSNPHVAKVHYPLYNESKPFYDACKRPDGGYGGLLSVIFKEPEQAIKFYDAVESAKGPSLGTNFTLTSPYTILAHYEELDFVEQFGVDRHLIRISVGLENLDELLNRFKLGLAAIEA